MGILNIMDVHLELEWLYIYGNWGLEMISI